MSSMSVAEAKARFATLIDETAKKALKTPRSNFGDFLLTYPGGVDLDRNSSRLREADLE